jgi:hypothetical protein
METTVIHLTTSDSFQQVAQIDHSKLIIDAFVESCKALDASIFEPYMDEENVFESKNKYLFLASMKELFDSFKDKKAVFINVNVEDSTCKGCQYGKPIKLFSVKGWGRVIFTGQFAYRINVEKGILIDIYRCNYFRNSVNDNI